MPICDQWLMGLYPMASSLILTYLGKSMLPCNFQQQLIPTQWKYAVLGDCAINMHGGLLKLSNRSENKAQGPLLYCVADRSEIQTTPCTCTSVTTEGSP